MATKKPALKSRQDGRTRKPRAAISVDDRYFAEQSSEKRLLLERLRALVRKAAPDATVSIKWGVPFYTRNGKNLCALAAFKEDVAINFFASPDSLADPEHKLEGSGKANRMYKVRSARDIDGAQILRWLRAASS